MCQCGWLDYWTNITTLLGPFVQVLVHKFVITRIHNIYYISESIKKTIITLDDHFFYLLLSWSLLFSPLTDSEQKNKPSNFLSIVAAQWCPEGATQSTPISIVLTCTHRGKPHQVHWIYYIVGTCVPHGVLSYGLDRLVCRLCSNILWPFVIVTKPASNQKSITNFNCTFVY